MTTMLALGIAAALAAPAAQDQASVRAFLTGIYRHYGSEKQKGASLDDPKRWFEPGLAVAMRRDARDAARRGEVGALDGDPKVSRRKSGRSPSRKAEPGRWCASETGGR